MKQKIVKITITAPFWFRLWMAISFLKTGVFEWEENSFYDELLKELYRKQGAKSARSKMEHSKAKIKK